jgi:hypothetical protein
MLLLLLLSATTAWAQFNFNFGNMFQQQAAPEKQNMPSDSEWYQTNYENGARDDFLLFLCLVISIALLLYDGRRGAAREKEDASPSVGANLRGNATRNDAALTEEDRERFSKPRNNIAIS